MDTLDPLNTAQVAILRMATAPFTTEGQRYPEYRRYVEGDQPLQFATEKFKSAFGRQFKEFAYNRCASVVDAHTDRLQVDGFGADEETLAQKAQDIWDDNQMDVREGQVEDDAFGMGDAYVIVELDPKSGDVLIWPQYAENVRVWYSNERPGLVTQGVRQWVDDDKHVYLNIYTKEHIEKYRSARPLSSKDAAVDLSRVDWVKWQPEGDTAWPMPLTITDTVPVFHFGNRARVNSYGTSELRDVIPLQNAINKTVMDMMVAMEFAAFPQRVIIGVDVEDDATADSIQRFQTAIDRLLVLMGSADGKQPTIAEFSAAMMTQYLDVAEKFDQFIARVTRVPARYLTQEATAESGTSKRMDESPWVSKIEDRQRAFGWVWSEVMRYALRLTGVESEPGALRVNWKPAAPLSEGEQLEQAETKERIGWPFPAILREMGYEPDQITAIVKERDAEREASLVADFGEQAPGGEQDGEAAA